MFQTGALGRTGGCSRPSATGHLTLLFNSGFFFSFFYVRIKKEIDGSDAVLSLLCVTSLPQRISPVHLIPRACRVRLVCCCRRHHRRRRTGPGALILAGSHRCPSAPAQTMITANHVLRVLPLKAVSQVPEDAHYHFLFALSLWHHSSRSTSVSAPRLIPYGN